jgi:hypothetical protein
MELIDGWIQDRYTEVLDALPWKRQEADSVIQAPATYNTGTVTTTQGSASIVGLGTVWSAAMNGLMIRINNTQEYYQFTFVSGTTATLDRSYEAPSGTGRTYRIDQNIFLMPSNARIVREVRPMHDREKPLEMVTPSELNRIAGTRTFYGTPRYVAATWDNFSNPPQLQLEFYPVPDCPDTGSNLLSWSVDYIFDAADIDPEATSFSLLPFVKPAVLIAGVQASSLMPRPGYDGNLPGAEAHEAQFKALLATMAQINALQRGPQAIRLAPELRRQTPPRYRYGPCHKGYTG